MIERAIREVDAQFVYIDSLLAHFPANLNPNIDPDVRQALAPTIAMIQRNRAALLATRHIGKAAQANVKHRGLNSVAFMAVARSAFFFGPDPDAQEGRTVTIASLSKHNLSRPMPSWTFEIVGESIDGEAGPVSTSRVVWGKKSRFTAQQLGQQGADNFTEQAVSLIQGMFEDAATKGDNFILVKDLDVATKENGLKEHHIRQARKRLGIRAVQSNFGGPWQLRIS